MSLIAAPTRTRSSQGLDTNPHALLRRFLYSKESLLPSYQNNLTPSWFHHWANELIKCRVIGHSLAGAHGVVGSSSSASTVPTAASIAASPPGSDRMAASSASTCCDELNDSVIFMLFLSLVGSFHTPVKWSQTPRAPMLLLEIDGETYQNDDREPEDAARSQTPPSRTAFSI